MDQSEKEDRSPFFPLNISVGSHVERSPLLQVVPECTFFVVLLLSTLPGSGSLEHVTLGTYIVAHQYSAPCYRRA